MHKSAELRWHSYIEFWIRLGLCTAWFLIATFVVMLILPFRWKDPSLGATFARLLARPSQWILGLKVVVENEQRLYVNQPCIYVANHQSNLDIVTCASAFPYRTVVIGKKELKRIPLFGLFFEATGMIMIDRKNRTNSIAGLDQAKEALHKKGHSIWIFPEGTRNRGSAEMLAFKKGAYHIAISAQVPVVPVVQPHLFTFCQYKHKRFIKGTVRIKVLEPVPTTGMTLDDMPRLMHEVRSRMEATLALEEMRPPPGSLDA